MERAELALLEPEERLPAPPQVVLPLKLRAEAEGAGVKERRAGMESLRRAAAIPGAALAVLAGDFAVAGMAEEADEAIGEIAEELEFTKRCWLASKTILESLPVRTTRFSGPAESMVRERSSGRTLGAKVLRSASPGAAFCTFQELAAAAPVCEIAALDAE